MNNPFSNPGEVRPSAGPLTATVRADQLSLRLLLGMARRQARAVAFCALAGGALGVAYLASATPLYTATTTLSLNPLALPDHLGGTVERAILDGLFDGEIEILRSEKIASDVIATVGSAALERPEGVRPAMPLRLLLPLIGRPDPGARGDLDARRHQVLLDHLRSRFGIDRGAGYVIRLSYTSPSAHRSAEILDGFVEAYRRDRAATQEAADADAIARVEAQIAAMRRRLDDATTAAESFQSRAGLVALAGQPPTGQAFDLLSRQVSDSTLQAAQARTRLSSLREVPADRKVDVALAEAGQDPVIDGLRRDYATLVARNAATATGPGGDDASHVRLAEDILRYEATIRGQFGRLTRAAEHEYEIAAAQEATLRDRLRTVRAASIDTARAAARLQHLQSQADAYRAALNELLVRQEAVLHGATGSADAVRVISPATVPVFTSAPNGPLSLALAILAGGLAGVGLGCAREARDTGLRGALQVQRALGILCVGLLRDLRRPRAGARVGGAASSLRHSIEVPFDDFTEALRALRLAIDQHLGLGGAKTIGFAPARSGHGATTAAKNFASLLAAAGIRTLLIDADLREAGLSEAMGPARSPGFSNRLSGETVPDDCMASEADSGLTLCFAGTSRETAITGLSLATPDVGRILAEMAAPFQCVVLDLPALDRFVDARAMARFVDAMVIVAHWGKTEAQPLARVLAADPDLRQKVVGVLLNRVEPARMRLYADETGPDGLA